MFQQAAQQRRLARTDFARDDNEPLILMQSVLEVRHRPAMASAAEIKRRIRIELEWLASELEIRFVHLMPGQNRMPRLAVTAFSVKSAPSPVPSAR